MARIVVTGGAGVIGSHLCERLLKDGYEVVCVDNLLTGAEKNIQHLKDNPQFRFINYDVIKPLPEDLSAEYVFHLASPASPNHHSNISYLALPMETMMVNTIGTLEVAKFAKKNNAIFVFTSTSEIYGDPLEHPQKEEYRGNVSTTGIRSVYDEAKRFGETLTAYYIRDHGLDGRIARIFNTYGPRMQLTDKRMVIDFIVQALSNKPITVFGDGTQTRSLCYVDDLVDGLTKLMFTQGIKGSVINLGNPEEHSVWEYAEIIKKLTGSESEIINAEELPEDDPKRRRPDITRAQQILNWQPTTSLEDGLRRTIAYVKSDMDGSPPND